MNDFNTTLAIFANFTKDFPKLFDAGDEAEPISPPEALIADYIEIGYLCAVFCLGVPINLFVFYRQFLAYRALRRCGTTDVKTAFLLQKLNLNIANLMMVVFYCPTMIGWLVTYRWVAGDVMCRITRFTWALCFHLSSNMVAGIALDRLRNVIHMTAMYKKQDFSHYNAPR